MTVNLPLFFIAFGWLMACLFFAFLSWLDICAERSRRIYFARHRVHVYGSILRVSVPLGLHS